MHGFIFSGLLSSRPLSARRSKRKVKDVCESQYCLQTVKASRRRRSSKLRMLRSNVRKTERRRRRRRLKWATALLRLHVCASVTQPLWYTPALPRERAGLWIEWNCCASGKEESQRYQPQLYVFTEWKAPPKRWCFFRMRERCGAATCVRLFNDAVCSQWWLFQSSRELVESK